MRGTLGRTALIVFVVAALSGVVAACGGNDDNGGGGGGGATATATAAAGKSGKIALLLPETKTTRYEAHDRPLFEAKVKALCPDCQVIYNNADQDASKQQSQAEAAITQGAKVMVLDPVDSLSAASIAKRAKQSNIPVISYDRLILNGPVDYYIAFDSVKVGRMQAQGLLDAVGSPSGKSIVMINGAPTDNNAKLFKQGAHEVLDPSGVKIAKEYDTPDWSADKAQTEMDQALTSLGRANVKGVYSANDGMATGIAASLKGAGLTPGSVPLTGQDAEVAGIQRIIAGEQTVDVYKPIQPQAETAAQVAVDLVRGQQPPAELLKAKTDNGAGMVPTTTLQPVAVTKENAKDTVFKAGLVTPAQVCVGRYKQFCDQLGIS